jgi:hypothetical protein
LAIVTWAGAAFLVLLIVMLIPLLRRDRSARFFGLGMMLSLLPICATFPADRLLMFVGIGASGLLAQFLADVFAHPPVPRVRRVTAKLLVGLFVFLHLVAAPVAMPIRAGFLGGQKHAASMPPFDPPLDDTVREQTVILVNAPSMFHVIFLPLQGQLGYWPMPKHTRTLAPDLYPVTIRRTNDHTLVVRPDRGFLSWPIDRLFRSERHPMTVGQRVEVAGMTVEITALIPDGRPAEARFTFDAELDDPSLRWFQWDEAKFIPFPLPAVGEQIVLEPRIMALWGR